MSLGRRIFYNTLAQSLGKIFAVFLGLINLGLLSRYLGERGFGEYATVLAFLGLFVVIADFGLYLYVVREIAKPETNHPKIIGNAMGLRLATALGSLVLGGFIALFFSYDPIVKKTIFLGIAAFLFVSLNQVLVGIFQKNLAQHLMVVSETLGRALNLFLVYTFIKESLSLPYFVVALVAANGAIFFLTLIFAKRYESFGIEFDWKFWREILKTSWPLVFAVILNLLYFKTDTVILSIFHSPKAVGVYSLPYKLLEGLLAFPAMFVGLIMPLLSASAFRDWPKFRQILQQAFDAIWLMTIPVVITVLSFSQEIVDLLKGKNAYADSPRILQILIFAAAIIFFGTLFGYAVVALDKQKTMIKGYLAGAVVGLALYFLLIPAFSYWGAAIGTVVTEIVVASYAYILVRQTSGQSVSGKIILKALPAAIVLVIFLKFIKIYWVARALLGGISYLLVLIATKAVPLAFVKEIFFMNNEASIPPPPQL